MVGSETACADEQGGALGRLKQEVGARTAKLLRGMLENTEDSLFEDMHETDSKELMKSYFNTMRAVKLQRKAVLEEFANYLQLGWQMLETRSPGVPLPVPEEVNEVRLAVNRTNYQFQQLFSVFEHNLRRLRNIDEETPIYHPLQIEQLFASFWYATEKLGCETAERQKLLPLFDRFVSSRIGPTVAAANDIIEPR